MIRNVAGDVEPDDELTVEPKTKISDPGEPDPPTPLTFQLWIPRGTGDRCREHERIAVEESAEAEEISDLTAERKPGRQQGGDGRPRLRLVSNDTSDEVRAKILLRKPIYQIRIALVGIEPEIWRRVLVTGNTSLGKLHDLIQLTMGWEDCHLHMFQLYDGRLFSRQEFLLKDAFEEAPEEERRVKLRKVAKEVGSAFCYQYDFGDDWLHRIVVEDILTPQEAKRTPRCIDGGRACPPEDVGGPPGYERYLMALDDPHHPEHRQMREWQGAYDPEALDLEEVNSRLRRAFPNG